MRHVALLSLAGVVCAVIGGTVYWAVDGGTSLTRSIAYGCWFAATVVLLVAAAAGQKVVWRRTNLPLFEGWVFVTSAVVLTVAGAALDAAGN